MRAPGTFLLLVCVAIAVAVVAVLLIDGSDEESAPAVVQDTGATATTPDERAPDPANAPAAEGIEPVAPPSHELDLPPKGYPIVWVRDGREVEIHVSPGGKVVEVAERRSKFGSPNVFGVVRRDGEWAGVTTPYLPNNRLGWVRLDARDLRAGWTRLSIVVDLSERRAELRRPKHVVRSFSVSVGMPGAETPVGRFSVTDTFRGDLNSAYGCCALALSANQPRLPSGWLGGTRIAIHGTYGALGLAVSHGCVRAANDDVDALVDKVPLGTPVFIRA